MNSKTKLKTHKHQIDQLYSNASMVHRQIKDNRMNHSDGLDQLGTILKDSLLMMSKLVDAMIDE